jgi:hypothetical protein
MQKPRATGEYILRQNPGRHRNRHRNPLKPIAIKSRIMIKNPNEKSNWTLRK